VNCGPRRSPWQHRHVNRGRPHSRNAEPVCRGMIRGPARRRSMESSSFDEVAVRPDLQTPRSAASTAFFLPPVRDRRRSSPPYAPHGEYQGLTHHVLRTARPSGLAGVFFAPRQVAPRCRTSSRDKQQADPVRLRPLAVIEGGAAMAPASAAKGRPVGRPRSAEQDEIPCLGRHFPWDIRLQSVDEALPDCQSGRKQLAPSTCRADGRSARSASRARLGVHRPGAEIAVPLGDGHRRLFLPGLGYCFSFLIQENGR